MNVLVTGGSGLVGRNILDALLLSNKVTNLDIVPPTRNDIPFIQADILDSASVMKHVRGFDAVVHLAGIPHPLTEPAEKVFRVNVKGTSHVLEAAALHGIPKVVFMSSESTLGFAFGTIRHVPDYLPIDENHAVRPQDSYGLSKIVCEMLCEEFSRRSGLKTVSLRAPWIWVPEEKEVETYRNLVREYQRWEKNLWAYIHVLDVAQAISLVLEYDPPEHYDVFFVCADNNWTDVSSRELVRKFMPEIQDIREGLHDHCSLISAGKAKRVLGFSPAHDRADLLGMPIERLSSPYAANRPD